MSDEFQEIAESLAELSFEAEFQVYLDEAIEAARAARELFDSCQVPFHPETYVFNKLFTDFHVAKAENDADWDFAAFWWLIQQTSRFQDACAEVTA